MTVPPYCNSAPVVTGLSIGLGDETAETHHGVQGPAARLIGRRASHFLFEADVGAWRGEGHGPQRLTSCLCEESYEGGDRQ